MNNSIRGLLVMASLFITVATCVGQSTANVAVDCIAADVDASFKFTTNPHNDQTVAINFRNISEHSCVLRGGVGAMFDNFRQGHNIWTKDCRNCSSDGKQLYVPLLTLKTGESGHILLQWMNSSMDGSSSCQEADGFNANLNSSGPSYLVVAPTLLTRVCSVVRADSYLPGEFGEKDQALDGSQSEMEPNAKMTLTSSGSTLYAGYTFSFLATVEDSSELLPIGERSCPFAFIHTRAADGGTTFEEITPYAKCTILPSANNSGRLITILIRAPGLGVLNEPGATSVQIHALMGSAQAHDVAFVSSNKLDLNIVDPVTMPRTWGPEVMGVAVSLALDKGDYKIGEDVPLRLAVENFSAEKTIQSGDLPCGAGVTIEVRDSAGRVVTPHDARLFCLGHGWTVDHPKGKVVPVVGLTLQTLGMLPDHADTYTIVATWNALSHVEGAPGINNYSNRFDPYAVVHSRPASFHLSKAGGGS
jgi:hypothetical protein